MVTSMEIYRCPECRGDLTKEGDRLRCRHGHSYTIHDDILGLVHPPELLDSDAEFQAKYDATAEQYDSSLGWMWRAFSADEDTERTKLVDLLNLQPGMRVLETGCGTGADSWRILDRLGDSGQLWASDLSGGMLQVARRRLSEYGDSVQLVQANGAYLPFADDVFDAAYHFGGINAFSERRRAISEMARVVRPGGRVVFGDEGIAPWQRRKRIGRILVNANPLYAHTPPMSELPETAHDVQLRWIISNAFYSVDFTVGTTAPPVDLDLPIPGKGDTLRSRFASARR
jgi:ubiquinone/menaquinone biosynthesis C-methylase UbiE